MKNLRGLWQTFLRFGAWAFKHVRALLVSLVVLILTVRYDAQIKSAVTSAFGAMDEWALAPVGRMGLLLVLWVALVVALFGIDHFVTYPIVKQSFGHFREWLDRKRPPPAPLPVPLSTADRESIQHMRVLWNRKGVVAGGALRDLYAAVIEGLRENLYWWDVLPAIRERLENASLAMESAIGANSHLSLAEVIDRFNQLYRAYVRTAKWLVRLDGHELPIGNAPPYGELYRRWDSADRAFHADLVHLHEWPEYKGKLAIVIGDGELQPFLDRGLLGGRQGVA